MTDITPRKVASGSTAKEAQRISENIADQILGAARERVPDLKRPPLPQSGARAYLRAARRKYGRAANRHFNRATRRSLAKGVRLA